MSDYPRFELVSEFANQPDLLPTRATFGSAGYDFVVAQDTVVPSYQKIFKTWNFSEEAPLSLDFVAGLTKSYKCKPTLVPTGVKAYIPNDLYLQISVRSSCPLKHWLILGNGVGIIDADYYNNPDNEGHIFFQIINLFPQDIILHRGDKIGQGIFLPYARTKDDKVTNMRIGGFGSTSTPDAIYMQNRMGIAP